MSAPPVRTLHLTNAWHPTSGGIRTFYRALLDRAAFEGRHMTLVVPSDRDATEQVGEHARIHYLAAHRSPLFDTRYRVILPHRYLLSRSDLWQLMTRVRPDVVEICDKYALVYLAGLARRRAAGAPRPTLIGLSCERMDDNVAAWLPGLPAGRAFARAYMRRVYVPQFDAHVANSWYTALELLPHARRVHVCPMGVDTRLFGPPRRRESLRRAIRARAGAGAGEALLLYAGRVSPEKNIGLLVDTARVLTGNGVPFRMLVAGAGPGLEALRVEADRRAPGRVVFLDHEVDREALADLVANVDVFVHPNPREPFGIGPLEAMASGTPVVVPDAGGVLEYASASNAWLASPTATAFAAAIDRALQDHSLRLARVSRALQTAADFSWPAVASNLLATYDRIHAARAAGLMPLPESSQLKELAQR